MFKQNRKLLRLINKKAKSSKSHKTIKNPRKVKKALARFIIKNRRVPIKGENARLEVLQWGD